MIFEVDKCNSPTFNYFVVKINQENGDTSHNVLEHYKCACDYIKQKYPEAYAGSNYWNSIGPEVPLYDQFFLRKMTFRSCLPPFKDEDLEVFEQQVQDAVNKEATAIKQSDDSNQEYTLQIKIE